MTSDLCEEADDTSVEELQGQTDLVDQDMEAAQVGLTVYQCLSQNLLQENETHFILMGSDPKLWDLIL